MTLEQAYEDLERIKSRLYAIDESFSRLRRWQWVKRRRLIAAWGVVAEEYDDAHSRLQHLHDLESIKRELA